MYATQLMALKIDWINVWTVEYFYKHTVYWSNVDFERKKEEYDE